MNSPSQENETWSHREKRQVIPISTFQDSSHSLTNRLGQTFKKKSPQQGQIFNFWKCHQISSKFQNRFRIDSQKFQVRPSKKCHHSRGETSPFGTSFRKHTIKFLQNFRIEFESIRRNVSSDLQKVVFSVGVKLQHVEPLFVNMLSIFFKISELISKSNSQKC